MSVTVHFNDEEEVVVKTALSHHEEGLKEAKVLTTTDPNIEDPEMLLDLVGQLDHDLQVVNDVKRRLNGSAG